MNSSASYLELILESKSFNDLLNRVSDNADGTYDLQVFDSMQLYRDEVEQKTLDCEDRRRKFRNINSALKKKSCFGERNNKFKQTVNDFKAATEIQSTQNEKQALMNQLSEEEARTLKS